MVSLLLGGDWTWSGCGVDELGPVDGEDGWTARVADGRMCIRCGRGWTMFGVPRVGKAEGGGGTCHVSKWGSGNPLSWTTHRCWSTLIPTNSSHGRSAILRAQTYSIQRSPPPTADVVINARNGTPRAISPSLPHYYLPPQDSRNSQLGPEVMHSHGSSH
jgi:hypothetical protein